MTERTSDVNPLALSCSPRTTLSAAVHCWAIFQLEPSSVPAMGGSGQPLPPVDLSLYVNTPCIVPLQCCGVVWCGVLCCAVLCCAVLWCGVLWCGVVCCGVVWCGVLWCGVVCCGVVCCACALCFALLSDMCMTVWYCPKWLGALAVVPLVKFTSPMKGHYKNRRFYS